MSDTQIAGMLLMTIGFVVMEVAVIIYLFNREK